MLGAPDPADDRDPHRPLGVATTTLDPRRRPIVIGLAIAVLATGIIVGSSWFRDRGLEPGDQAPGFEATTLDGERLATADLRGRPVIINFWGPSCIPCRDEFPLFIDRLAAYADDGLQIVGVLMFDAPAPAQDFIAEYGATWPTVDDPDGAIRTAYRAVARPQTYFIDRDGVIRSIQVGELTEADFERQYARISGAGAP